MQSIASLLGHDTIEASAPCRVDMGGTLDLSTFYLPLYHLRPATFNIALDMRTHIRLSAHAAGKIKITSRGFDPLEVAAAAAPFDHPLGLMLAIATHFQADGVHIDIASASPPRSALGGSSVAAVALIWAFYKMLAATGRRMPARRSVAMLAHAIESSVAGVPCGLQDQLAAVYGGVNGWQWTIGESNGPFTQITMNNGAATDELERRMLVAYCGVPHVSKDINSTWVRRFISGETRTEWIQITHLSNQFIAAMQAGQYTRAVDLMNQETRIRRGLTPEVLDDIGQALVDAAVHKKCGARFTGAGGGGCIWALGEPESLGSLRTEWNSILARHPSATILDTRIDTDGLL